jgi:RNA polymerase sigma factor (sigma-70 family)
MEDWERIRERYGPLVWKTVYKILGNHTESLDCFQDVFAELLERSTPMAVRGWPAFLRWLAVRRALDRLRKRAAAAKRMAGDDDIATVAAASPAPDTQALWNELMERVRHEASCLPRQQAEAFWLQCVEEMSQAEIGQQLGVSANAVGVLVHRARQRLRQSLADLNPAKREIE